ncbi:hypothetical protein ACTXT7_008035 [Hymenolepis weldensis]
MDLDRSSYSDDSESFIPSSNFEPPPPVDCILQKSHASVDETGINGFDRSSRRSKYGTQPDEFEDIHFQSANSLGDIASPDTFGSDKFFMNPHSSLQDNSTFGSQNSTFSPAQLASSSKISENSENVDPKRSGQLQKLLSPALNSRASVPSTIPTKVAQVNLLEFRSQVNTEFSSIESLNSISHGAGTNTTTSTRTTRSGSDLFKTDSSSAFREPLVPPRRRNVTSTSTNTTTYEEIDNLPAFSYTLSLAIQRLPTQIEKSCYVEFKVPDFAKTITWQHSSWADGWQHGCAPLGIEPATSDFADGPVANLWCLLPLTNLGSFYDTSYHGINQYGRSLPSPLSVDLVTPGIADAGVDHLVTGTLSLRLEFAEEKRLQQRPFLRLLGYWLTLSVTGSAKAYSLIPMNHIVAAAVLQLLWLEIKLMPSASESHPHPHPLNILFLEQITPESNSRTSTSSSEYFLPWKAVSLLANTSCKRKLNESAKEIQESVLSETNIGAQSMTISSNTMDAQSRTSTSSSEYLIPVKPDDHDRPLIRAKAVTSNFANDHDVVEMESQPKSSEKSSESVTSLAIFRLTVIKRHEASLFDQPGTTNPSQIEVQTLVSNTSEPTLRSILRNRKGINYFEIESIQRSANMTTVANQQETIDSPSDYDLRTLPQVFSSNRPNSQEESTGPQTPESATIMAEPSRMTNQAKGISKMHECSCKNPHPAKLQQKPGPPIPGENPDDASFSKNVRNLAL